MSRASREADARAWRNMERERQARKARKAREREATDATKQRIQALEEENAALRERLDALERLVDRRRL